MESTQAVQQPLPVLTPIRQKLGTTVETTHIKVVTARRRHYSPDSVQGSVNTYRILPGILNHDYLVFHS